MTNRLLLCLITLACLAQPCAAQEGVDRPGSPLTLAEYLEAGVPDVSKPWGPPEYGEASIALDRVMKEHGPGALPRQGSEVLTRMLSADSALVETDDPAAVLMERVDRMMGLRRCLSAYVTAHQQIRGYSGELTDLLIGLLGTLPPLLESTEAFRKGLPADDPSHDERMRGLERMRGGLVEMLGGCAAMLTELPLYKRIDRERMADALIAALPPCAELLTPPHLEALVAAARDARAKVDTDRLRERLDDMLRILAGE